MRTIGQILKEYREAKLYTLEDIEKHTKIRKELLEALERDDYDKLPPATFIQGFIKNYGKFLGLDTDKLLAIFRRGFEARLHPPVILESFSNPINKSKFNVTPYKVVVAAVVLVILGFFAYLWVEYRQFVGEPTLQVISPQDQQSVDLPSITVEGGTDPEVKVAINNQQVSVDEQGKFHEEVKLSSSINTITITATGRFGQTAKVERTVILKK